MGKMDPDRLLPSQRNWGRVHIFNKNIRNQLTVIWANTLRVSYGPDGASLASQGPRSVNPCLPLSLCVDT